MGSGEGAPDWTWTAALLGLLLYGGIPGTGLPYWAIAMATRRLPAFTISLGLLATPVFSVVVSTLWLREPLSASLVAAVVLILGGIAIGATDARAAVTSRSAPAARSDRANGR